MPTPHCKHCGYPLTGLATPSCPECGQPFDLHDLSTFENRYPRDWGDRLLDLVIPALIAIIILTLIGSGVIFHDAATHPGR